MTFAVVLAGGDVPKARVLEGIGDAAQVVAADGGVKIARTLGLPVNVVIGDLDSSSEGDLAWARAEGAEIEQHPTDKDKTDLELALGYADETGADRIIVVGIEGGRLDHEFGNWAAISARRNARIEAHGDRGVVTVLHADGHADLEMSGSPGELISVVARLGVASGVTTTGLRWELDDATLSPCQTRGISNEFELETASVRLEAGTLMVARPAVQTLNQ